MESEIPKILEPFGSCLYHYTTLERAVENILPTWTMRMSPCSKMRDPRESGALLLTVTGFQEDRASGREIDDETFRAEIAKSAELFPMGYEIKDLVKILSLTVDHREPGSDTDKILDRGFSHPRLWEQYGGAHRGVCLCFDGAALTKAVTRGLDRQGFGKPFYDEVAYRDGEIDAEALALRIQEIRDVPTVKEAFDTHIAKHRDELFFTKLLDWETEREFRFVVTTTDVEPVEVSVRNAVRAVILGADLDAANKPAFAALCGNASVEILRVKWMHGVPQLSDPMAPGQI